MILELKSVSVTLDRNPVLRDVSFAVEEGESVAIIGPNGCGKTVLLKAILGLLPHTGEITWRPRTTVGYVPQKIAADLNREGIPSPSGKRWSDTTIRGNRAISSGILNCELCIGVIRWNRQRQMKNPDTGRRVLRLNPESEWIRTDVPALRIVP